MKWLALAVLVVLALLGARELVRALSTPSQPLVVDDIDWLAEFREAWDYALRPPSSGW